MQSKTEEDAEAESSDDQDVLLHENEMAEIKKSK